jgi:hypothetical protein
MAVLNFIIAVVALVIAILAYKRTSEKGELSTQIDSLRQKTADILSKTEKALRTKEEKKDNNKKAEEGQ